MATGRNRVLKCHLEVDAGFDVIAFHLWFFDNHNFIFGWRYTSFKPIEV